ncbi:cation:proton antiporter [Corynebacterium sp. ES2794-CONJ1]|uniref:cation:proton antiporter n=1 Tax=unclassified Corynebacterium TaxID=2624378 RepID=UPI0021676195|nr:MULTISPECIES: cation:proton antiporter [unclassified Corynebacterium]MCS4490340.1 cation:proton antiporter [Corynebacterium sp. ES2775-CONJ]MCS4492118.1 cation:proton antiporter [Corynebacterium sp. ES2715-CONJ3]MCS4532398.1 cation:proton antiporter [Corynebacterium sp. ES2730-CONJ]MCU9519639.1 cation:proton antiporter [Corynebacterium sp. ES2794-CONJ1]
MFFYLAVASSVLMILSIMVALVAMLSTANEFSRAVISDVVFYGMIGLYLVWTMFHDTQIAYEVVMLAALAGGVLPTMSVARIIAKGRR